jgi:subtilase family serine protease
VHPQKALAGRPAADLQFGCQSRPISGKQGARCYTPAQIQKAYGFTPLLAAGDTGAGRTIVIIDAYSNPYIVNDLEQFDQTFGLPAADFETIAPQGLAPFDFTDPVQVGWASEISLDVQWAHAAAPGARIVLALARSSNDADLLATTKYVVNRGLGDVISQSFGEAEQCMNPAVVAGQHAIFATAARRGISVFASSGDSGAAQGACPGPGAVVSASTPASDPNVTGVGGTTLNATNHGAYVGETAWTEIYGCNPPAIAATDVHCSGGGFSTLYPRPDYQASAPHTRPGARGVPDVSYDAAVNGGVLGHCGVCNVTVGYAPSAPVFFIFGGTSAGSPQWAGIAAIADQYAGRRLGLLNPALYAIGTSPQIYAQAFHDVTTGNNDVAEINGFGYDALPNWDPVTGLGSPNVEHLVPLLGGLS